MKKRFGMCCISRDACLYKRKLFLVEVDDDARLIMSSTSFDDFSIMEKYVQTVDKL